MLLLEVYVPHPVWLSRLAIMLVSRRIDVRRDLHIQILVSKVGAMTLALARTFAPNLGKVEKRVKPDGTVEIVKMSGLRGIGHAGLTSK